MSGGGRARGLPAPALAWLGQLHAAPARADADLVGTACVLGLMAHRTPAWTEAYVDLLDRLIKPRIDRPPGADQSPERLAPLLVLLGVRAMITTDGRWDRSGADQGGAWTHDELAGHGAQRWPEHPAAALGLLLHDNCYGTTLAPGSAWASGSLPDSAPDSTSTSTSSASAGAVAPDLCPSPTWALAWEWDLGDLGPLVAAPLAPGGTVVDVDFPAVALSRAEWVGEALHLRLAVVGEQPAKRTTFRLVGTEPRVWYLTGIDGTTMDSAGAAVVVRVPHVNGVLEFTAGSY